MYVFIIYFYIFREKRKDKPHLTMSPKSDKGIRSNPHLKKKIIRKKSSKTHLLFDRSKKSYIYFYLGPTYFMKNKCIWIRGSTSEKMIPVPI